MEISELNINYMMYIMLFHMSGVTHSTQDIYEYKHICKLYGDI